jgi:hypothetical protein
VQLLFGETNKAVLKPDEGIDMLECLSNIRQEVHQKIDGQSGLSPLGKKKDFSLAYRSETQIGPEEEKAQIEEENKSLLIYLNNVALINIFIR